MRGLVSILLALSVLCAPVAGWRQIWSYSGRSGPQPRHAHTAVNDGRGGMIMFGGFGGKSQLDFFDDVWRFDYADRRWARVETGATKPIARASHSAVLWHGDSGEELMLVFGGAYRQTGGNEEMVDADDLWQLNLTATPAQWERINAPNGPSARNEQTAVLLGDTMYVYGGLSFLPEQTLASRSDTWRYNVRTRQWSAMPTQSLPPSRFSHAAALWQPTDGSSAKLVVYGGRTMLSRTPPHDWTMLGDLWVLDLSSGRWRQLRTDSSASFSRSYHSAVVTGDRLAIFAGYTRVISKSLGQAMGYVFNDVLVRDLTASSGTWEEVIVEGSEPTVRYDHTATLWGGHTMVTFGGRFQNPRTDMWAVNITSAPLKRAEGQNYADGSENAVSAMQFVVAIISMMFVCFCLFVVSLRRGGPAAMHHHPGGGAAAGRNARPRGTPQSVIAKLPVTEFHAAAAGDEDSSDSMCPICICDFEEGDKVRTLPCGHPYHPSCVDLWLRQNNTCPMCKQAVDGGAVDRRQRARSRADSAADVDDDEAGHGAARTRGAAATSADDDEEAARPSRGALEIDSSRVVGGGSGVGGVAL